LHSLNNHRESNFYLYGAFYLAWVSSNLDRKSKICYQNAWQETNDIFVPTFVHAIKQSAKVPLKTVLIVYQLTEKLVKLVGSYFKLVAKVAKV